MNKMKNILYRIDGRTEEKINELVNIIIKTIQNEREKN